MDSTGRKKQILVVDDDEIQLSFVDVILNSEYDVVLAASGGRALELLAGGLLPDLVLLDVLMPGMDGFETYAQMRAMSEARSVPVIFLTSVNTSEEIRKALKLGAADYITKPYIMENIKNRVRNAIHLYGYKKEDG